MRTEGAAAESELLEDIAQGSEPALVRLYDRYSKLLYSLILAILKDPRDAEEVLQEVFLQVWKLADRYDSRRGSAYKWLVTLARSRSIDRTRSRNFAKHRETEGTSERLEFKVEWSQPSPLDAVLILERAEVVQEVLDKIPPDQYQVMKLAYFLGYSQSEIARELETPLGTVKSRMRHGLIALRRLLAEELRP